MIRNLHIIIWKHLLNKKKHISLFLKRNIYIYNVIQQTIEQCQQIQTNKYYNKINNKNKKLKKTDTRNKTPEEETHKKNDNKCKADIIYKR